MIVDNDVDLLRQLPSALEPWGLVTNTLDDSRQFWDVLQAVKPNLLILKINMPYLTGIELCKVLRTDPDWYKLPILYLNDADDDISQEEVLASGGDELLCKPLDSKQLAHRINYYLDRYQG